jgi:hypothetical protein
MRSTHRRSLTALALASLVLGAGSAAAAPPKVGPNLVTNPGFEQTSFEAVATATAPANNGKGQPVMPTSWTVEGATTLFDHSENVFKEGKRAVGISGALGGGRQICDGSSGSQVCTPNPAPSATGAAPLRPFWVSDAPIKVDAGRRYRFSTFIIMPSFNPDAGVPGEGAETQVRWLDAGGRVISTVTGPTLVKGPKRVIGWKLVSADVVAPQDAVGAKLALGHTDYTTTGIQVAFDAVTFARLG